MAFAVAAVLPTVVAVVTLTHSTDGAIAQLGSQLSQVGRDSVRESAGGVAMLSRKRLQETGNSLNRMAQVALQQSAQALTTASQDRIRLAAASLNRQGDESQQRLSERLMELSRQHHQRITGELIGISQVSARELTHSHTSQAEAALVGTIDRLVATSESLTAQISERIIDMNAQSAESLSSRLITEVGKEPVVNFKTLAAIFAQSLAGGEVRPMQEGYLSVVDRRGRVVASTKHRQGTSLRELSIVQAALAPDTLDNQLLTFSDGGEAYLGVFARRPSGGAVIFAYLADKARLDTEKMQADVQAALGQMTSQSSRLVAAELAERLPAVREEAVRLKAQALAGMEQTSRRVTEHALQAMRQRAEEVAQKSRTAMRVQARRLSDAQGQAMREQGHRITDGAVKDLQALAGRQARQAGLAMQAQSQRAVSETAQELQGQVRASGRRTAAQVPLAAERVADEARRRSLAIALGLLLGEAVLIGLASLVMSGRVAAPILTERQAAYEAQKRLERELEIASHIQQSMLPLQPPDVPGLDMAVYFKPADAVGGDYYDLIPVGERHLAIAVGDVNGHGMGAALLMAMAKSAFHTQTGRDPDVAAVMAGLNDMVFGATSERRFMTFFYALVDLDRWEMVSANAGHHFPYLFGVARELPEVLEHAPAYPLGVRQKVRYPLRKTSLSAGDGLVFFSDGIIELRNAEGEEFGFERFERLIQAEQGRGAEAVKQAILAAITDFGGLQEDDITLLVITFQTPPAPVAAGAAPAAGCRTPDPKAGW